jgi:glycosyltransferase involved in cell wall biosynthesis
MKCAFIISGKSPFTLAGGLGSYSVNLAQCLAKTHQVYLLFYGDQHEEGDFEYGKYIQVRHPCKAAASLATFIMLPKFVKTISQALENISVGNKVEDVVIWGAAIWGVAGIQYKKESKHLNYDVHAIASYFTTYKHEYDGQIKGAPIGDYGLYAALQVRAVSLLAGSLYAVWERSYLRQFDKLVIHYESSREILIEELGSDIAEKLVKTRYFSENFDRKGRGAAVVLRDNDKVLISTICRQDPRKGINVLLKALAILKSKGVPFKAVVAGDGPFRQYNERLSGALGLGDCVSFPGFIPSSSDLLEETDIFVLSSYEEGAGAISLLEAMASGQTIVTSDVDGIPEDFERGVDALLFPVDDEKALAASLKSLVEDSKLRLELAENVKKSFDKNFKMENMQADINKLLSSF